MTDLEKKLDALMRLCTAEDNDSYEAAKKEVRSLMTAAEKPKAEPGLEAEVCRVLTELGVPDHLTGHPYLVQAIMLVAKDRKQINNVSKPHGLYYTLAESFDTTPMRVERAIRHAVETAWLRCDVDVLNRYFGNIIDPMKGKTTNSEFIARVANVIRMRMKQ